MLRTVNQQVLCAGAVLPLMVDLSLHINLRQEDLGKDHEFLRNDKIQLHMLFQPTYLYRTVEQVSNFLGNILGLTAKLFLLQILN